MDTELQTYLCQLIQLLLGLEWGEFHVGGDFLVTSVGILQGSGAFLKWAMCSFLLSLNVRSWDVSVFGHLCLVSCPCSVVCPCEG